jgi:hypothetical protein
MSGLRFTIGDCRDVWRFVVPFLACGEVGGLIAVGIGLAESPFKDFWIGGVLGGLTGAIPGLVWHAADAHRCRTTRTDVAIFGVVVMVLLASVALFQVIPEELLSRRAIAKVRALDPSTISAIAIFREHEQIPFTVVTDARAISKFVLACGDIEKSHQGHYSPKLTWRVEVRAAEWRELSCNLIDGQDDEVIGYLNFTGSLNRRQFRSRSLREWLDRYAVAPTLSP